MPPKPPVRIARTPLKASSKSAPIARSPLHPSKHHAKSSQSPPSASKYTSTSATVRKYASISLTSIALCIFIRDYLVSIDTVIGTSMAPTLSPYAHETGARDWIIIQRGIRNGQDIKRGDIVTLWKPAKPEEISIKRVIGTEGDVVFPRRGYALDVDVVGEGAPRRVGGGWDGLPACGEEDGFGMREGKVRKGSVLIPKGHVWVEGDNWRNSLDSCDFGPVSLGLVDGKAKWVWRSWLGGLKEVGDEREKKGRTRVIKAEGK